MVLVDFYGIIWVSHSLYKTIMIPANYNFAEYQVDVCQVFFYPVNYQLNKYGKTVSYHGLTISMNYQQRELFSPHLLKNQWKYYLNISKNP